MSQLRQCWFRVIVAAQAGLDRCFLRLSHCRDSRCLGRGFLSAEYNDYR